MRILPAEPDPALAAGRRRSAGVVAAAILLPLALILIGSTPHPEWGYVLVAVVVAALWATGQIRGRRTRESTDERARDLHRRAASISWQLMAVVLVATAAWMDIRHGIRAAEPYLVLGVALVTSYLAAHLWQRRPQA